MGVRRWEFGDGSSEMGDGEIFNPKSKIQNPPISHLRPPIPHLPSSPANQESPTVAVRTFSCAVLPRPFRAFCLKKFR